PRAHRGLGDVPLFGARVPALPAHPGEHPVLRRDLLTGAVSQHLEEATMATHRPTPSTPPELSEGSGSDLPLDHALSLLLADETENALRWGAAVLESGPWTP